MFSSTSANASSLYEVTYKSGAISHTVIKTYQGSDYTTPAGIAQIINDVKDNAYALNYAMIIGGHGCGWTYADDWAQMQAKAKSPLSANNHSSAYPATRFFGSNTPGTYAIDVETLAQGIGQAGIKLQYLLFDNCYMANAETAYELRNATNWLIASTSEILAQGMPYVSMWPYLSSSTPSYQNITNTFLKFYSNYSTPCGSLSAIDCRQMDALANIMRNINSHYTLDESLIDSLQTLDGYNTSLFFDLSDYVEHVCPNATMLSDYEAQIKRTVPYAVATDTLYSYLYDHPVYIPVKKFSGMTFSDPSRNEVALKGKKNTSWWKATHQE